MSVCPFQGPYDTSASGGGWGNICELSEDIMSENAPWCVVVTPETVYGPFADEDIKRIEKYAARVGGKVFPLTHYDLWDDWNPPPISIPNRG